MNEIVAPRKILLTTDLSCRCDRALDRAIQLARAWDAELIAAHVVDPDATRQFRFDRTPASWRRLPSPIDRMRWRLRRDLGDAAGGIRVIVEEGEPSEILLAIAAREGCDLIVTGVARDETLGRFFLGNTVNRLVRGSAAPVLVVHDRATRPYKNIMVATDFSEASLQALLATSHLFPTAALTLFHAYDVPFSGFLDDQSFKRDLRAMEKELQTRFLGDDRVEARLRQRLDVVIEHGSPERQLSDYVEDQQMDLTVIGSHGRGALFDALIGSTAKALIEKLEGDLLIIRYQP
ncbi:universal stress protein [Sphingobium sp. YR768]|uniref:universal stress protein n=1 Tax=Sphingobium sp. YR768 TaxID=1884365 RepID=UPI0008B65AAD|nr:universal stress protein [Sphingobium sp. YR768]SEQ98937.1 Nucleotide-binding universal stress protein, UspA family [Sphingobium sp. YR768]